MKKLAVFALFLLFGILACSSSSQSADNPDNGGSAIRALVESRAARYADDQVLVADFYRIHRKLAYPLPVTEIYNPDFHVTGISHYPWEIWMTWDLEQRVYSLGWAAQWTGNEHYKELVRRDIDALAGWPRYDAGRAPHLAGAHAARLMVSAYRNWDWLGEDIRGKIEQGLRRFIDSTNTDWINDGRLELNTATKVLASELRLIANIPTIATIGRSMAARVCGHPLSDKLERHAEALIMAQLQLRGAGYTEAVAYDGYILDFVLDWLPEADRNFREELLASDELALMLEQSWISATPGNLMNVAPLNDVEPREMPFHASVHAKLAMLRGTDRQESWYLQKIPLEWIRTDALAALDGVDLLDNAEAPLPGVAKGLCTLTTRSGWSGSDLAVVMSATEVSVGHIQQDNGTIVIGAGGNWLIDDPGYQQYVPGLEREFTLGPTAHNYPVIGKEGVQTANKVNRLEVEQRSGLPCMAVDITGGYSDRVGVSKVLRKVWQAGDSLVVVADIVQFEGRSQEINYHWHANPEAALWLQDGSVRIVLDGESLWVTSAGYPLKGQQIKLLPGTRGQLTIGQTIPADGNDKIIWWLFKRGGSPARYELSADGAMITLAELTLNAL